MLKLQVFGKFEVVDECGQICSPSGQKAKGLLILLACSRGQTRSRLWLQDKLWSDRSRSQAAGSLRTCLNEIRKAFGTHQNALITDRFNIGIDEKQFTLDYRVEPHESGLPQYPEAFEDVDVRDREFEHAIREIRTSLKSRRSAPYNAEITKSPIVDIFSLHKVDYSLK